MRRHLAVQPIAEAVTLDIEVKLRLQVEPEALGGAEVPREAEGSVGGDFWQP